MRHHVTSLTSFLDCPRKYSYRVKDGLQPVFDGVARPVGSAIHKGLEALYAGDPHPVGVAYERYYQDFDEDVAARLTASQERDVEKGWKQVERCLQLYPWGPGEFDGIVALEREFEARIPFYPNNPEAPPTVWADIVGTVDRIVEHNGKNWIHDIKSTGLEIEHIRQSHSLSWQYPAYKWLVESNGIEVAGVIVEYVKKPRVGVKASGELGKVGDPGYLRDPIVVTNQRLAEFGKWAAKILALVDEGFDEMNPQSCYAYGRTCPYIDMCKNPERKEQIAAKGFVVRRRD